MRRLLAVLIAALCCTACATSHQAAGAVAADGVTTAAALSQGAVEVNPLGYATIPIRLGVIAWADTRPKEEGVPILHMARAVGWGAATNNVLFALGPLGALAGIMVGVGIWASGEEERQFWELCAWLKAEDPNIKSCTYNGVTA